MNKKKSVEYDKEPQKKLKNHDFEWSSDEGK